MATTVPIQTSRFLPGVLLAVEDASPVAPKKAKAVKESEPSPTILKNGSLPEKKQKTKSTKSSKKEKAQVREEEEAGEEPEPEPESAPVAAAAADDENDDEHPFSEEEEDDEANALAEAVNSDEEDAPLDGAAGALFKPGQDVGKAPKPAAKASKKASGAETGVLYVGHIPHGFYEHEMYVVPFSLWASRLIVIYEGEWGKGGRDC